MKPGPDDVASLLHYNCANDGCEVGDFYLYVPRISHLAELPDRVRCPLCLTPGTFSPDSELF